MKWFDQIANASRHIRVKREIDQATAAEESGVSLRTIQNIEAGKAVNASTLFAYLEFLGLLSDMLATLPDPDKPTPMEILAVRKEQRTPVRSKRSGSVPTDLNNGVKKRRGVSAIKEKSSSSNGKNFKWGDEQ